MVIMKVMTRKSRIRVEYIADLMRRNEWRKGSIRQLASEWHLTERSIRTLSAEASRVVLGELTDPDRVKPELCDILMKSIRAAFAAKKYKEVASVGRVYADILGLMADRHATLHVRTEPGEPTPANARALLEREFGNAVLAAAVPEKVEN